jgi:hypothetical protein
MSLARENFLRTKLVQYFQQLDPATPPRWGKMSVQHMIEHYSDDGLRTANGRLKTEILVVPPGKLPQLQEFLIGDKPLKENVINPILGKDLRPLRYKTVQGAIGALHEELIYFFEVFEKEPDLRTRNPFFGDLNFEQNVHLLYKHALHHLKQFGVVPPSV